MTHMMTLGKTIINFGRKPLRRIWRNSFCMRYWIIYNLPFTMYNLAFCAKRWLKFFSAIVSSRTVITIGVTTSCITSSIPTPIIIGLRMALM